MLNRELRKMDEIYRVIQRTKTDKKRKGFMGVRRDIVHRTSNIKLSVNSDIVHSNSDINLSVNNANETFDDNRNENPAGKETSTSTSHSNKNEMLFESSETQSKVSPKTVENIDAPSPKKNENLSGNRIIDTTILSSVFSEFLCPKCEFCCLELPENHGKKQGLASLLHLKCMNCKITREIYASTTTLNRGFDVNQRIVYSMRSLGNGYSALEKFSILMKITSPVTVKSCNKIVTKLVVATKAVAEETRAY